MAPVDHQAVVSEHRLKVFEEAPLDQMIIPHRRREEGRNERIGKSKTRIKQIVCHSVLEN